MACGVRSTTPGRIVFDPAREQVDGMIVVTQRALGRALDPLEVVELGGLELVEERADGATRRVLHLRYPGAAPATAESGQVVVETGDLETPRLTIPWTVLPARG